MTLFPTNTIILSDLLEVSKNAGKAIMEIYETNFEVKLKRDNSPVTEADMLSHEIICNSLRKITPTIPIISEESSDISFEMRSSWEKYWLIDPLDGTKEFITKNGEFTVNIALIEYSKPVLGVIHAPALNKTYWGSKELGSSYYQKNSQKEVEIKIRDFKDRDTLRIMISRSHPSEDLEKWLNNINKYKIVTMGSSLKLCALAKGDADIYPRFGSTCEWDIAAGHAILKYAGGSVLTLEKKELEYGKKESFINPYFIASGKY